MNRIELSTCGVFVELWHNGQRIYYVPINGKLHDAVGKCRDYIRKWAGDDNPEISKALKAKMNELDSLFMRMAFGEQWR